MSTREISEMSNEIFVKQKKSMDAVLTGWPLIGIAFAIWTLWSGKAGAMGMPVAPWIIIGFSVLSLLAHAYNEITLPNKKGYSFLKPGQVAFRFFTREVEVLGYGVVAHPAFCMMLDRLVGWKQILPQPYNWLGLILLIPSALVVFWTFVVFAKKGQGTPIPMEPTQRLVIEGPYCYVRNPMVVSINVVLFGLAVILGSWMLVISAVLSVLHVYIVTVKFEEPEMESCFGEEYQEYKKNVPAWFPKLRRT